MWVQIEIVSHVTVKPCYHNDSSFNAAYKNYDNRLSLFHANKKSIPQNLDQLTFYLQTLV